MEKHQQKAYFQSYLTRPELFLCILFFLLFAVKTVYPQQANDMYDRARVYTEKAPGDSVHLKIDNGFVIPISLQLDLFSHNLEGAGDSVIFDIVPAADSARVIGRFKIRNPDSVYLCTYKWKVVLGDTSKTPDLAYSYRYPYQSWVPYKVSQGPGGAFSHKNMFAYDFALPIGTPVTAAREGLVALVKDDSRVGGNNKALTRDANFIAIMHPDGTIANYIHLRAAALVKEGQWVHKGQIIGYSGNTGYTTGPHLHFEIIQPLLSAEVKQSVAFKWEPAVYAYLPVYGNYFLNSLFGKRQGKYRNMITES